MPTLPNMSLITPTLGGDSGTWDDKINAMMSLIDAHDHTSGKGVLVPVSGMNINADFAMAGYAVTGLGSIAFNAVTALAAGSKRLFVSSADNELYWRTNAGTNVKLTDGTSINTSLVGGILGDYSTVGAELAFDDANKQYTFKDQTATPTWARLASGPVRIYEYNTTESVYVELAAPAGLAAPYTVTWPLAVAGFATLLQDDGAGVLSYSNTLAAVVTFSGVKYTTARTWRIPAASYATMSDGTSAFVYSTAAPGLWTLGNSSTDMLVVPIVIGDEERITQVQVFMNKVSDATNTVTCSLVRVGTTGGRTVVATDTEAGAAIGQTSLVLTALTETVSGSNAYHLEITQSDATPSANDTIQTTIVTADRP